MSLMLAGSLCLLPFLLPYHQQPVLSFFPEWLAAALGIAASLTLLVGRGVSVSFVYSPVPARWLIAFAAFLAAQAATGGHAYSQLPLLAALYVLYAALMIWLGAQLTAAFGIERVAAVLAAFLLVGALANALAGLALLLLGSALSGSRGALLYAFWYAALGLLAIRVADGEGARRLKFAA